MLVSGIIGCLVHSHVVSQPLATGFWLIAGSDGSKASLRTIIRWIYGRLYRLLPQRVKVVASKLVFGMSGRLLVYRDRQYHPVNGLKRGVVTFSIDFELAWAWQYAKGHAEDYMTIALRERQQVPEILRKLNEHRIPATWATVGHLFLERCSCDDNGFAHPEISRPQHFESAYLEFTDGDWFQHDPCSNVQSAPAWYAPDLIEKILASDVKHEIACHGFSHVSFAHCSREVAEAELEACIQAMKPYGLRPTTWVFPTNEFGNLDMLVEKGFKIVRMFPEPWAKISLPVKRADGLWAVHDSSGVEIGGSTWDLEERLSRLKSFVDLAVETRLSAHFWFHPSIPTDQMHDLLFPLLRYCASLRDMGLIDILTMDQLVVATESALKQRSLK